MTFTFASYQSATGCTRYGPQGAQAFLTYMEERFPWQYSMGICSCRYVAGKKVRSHHGECRAYDMGVPTTSSGGARPSLGMQVIDLVLPHGRRLGIDHAIYNRTVWSASSKGGRYYTGVHPHYDHIHWGFTRNAGRNLTYATLVAVLGSPTKSQEDDLLPIRYGEEREDVRLLQGMMNMAYGSGLKEDALYGPATRSAVLESPMLGDTGEDEADPGGSVDRGETVNARMWRGLMLDFNRETGSGSGGGGLTKAEADKLYAEDGHGHKATVDLK